MLGHEIHSQRLTLQKNKSDGLENVSPFKHGYFGYLWKKIRREIPKTNTVRIFGATFAVIPWIN